MLALALVISHLAGGLRRETQLASLNALRARQLQTLAGELASAQGDQEVLQLGAQALAEAFSGPCQLAMAGSGGGPDDNTLEPTVRDGLHSCMTERAVLGPGTGRWPGLSAWYIPLGHKDEIFAAACIRPAQAGDAQGLDHAQALCILLAPSFWRVQVCYGFLDTPNIPDALALCQEQGLRINLFETSYFLSREIVVPTRGAGMARWRELLFTLMSRNAGNAADFFGLPSNCVIELGTRVQI